MTTGRRLRDRALRILVEKLDLTFTLGRFFGLVPVMILSRLVSDHGVLARLVADYQLALFFSTVVIYGGAQVYLVKQGLERRVFIFHMAYSAVAAAALIAIADAFNGTQLLAPFVFLVFFRSYYLLLASYLKFHPVEALYLVGMEIVALAVFTLSLSYWLAALASGVMVVAFMARQGMLKPHYAAVAARQYIAILRRNSGYFVIFLLQQTFTQITLAAYALVAVGEDYLQATHVIYIFALSFIAHSILFRLSLAKMGGSRRPEALLHHLRRTQQIALGLGVAAAAVVSLGYRLIETLLFGHVTMTPWVAALLGVMVLLNSINVGWSALFMSVRRPFQLAVILVVSMAMVLVGIAVTWWFVIPDGLYYTIIVALLGQTVLRTLFGVRLLQEIRFRP